MDFVATVVLLLLVMDPLGNMPLFVAALEPVRPERRVWVVARELLFALALFMLFLLIGDRALEILGLGEEAIAISGGIILFLISLKMMFPQARPHYEGDFDEEPLLVPLAVPLVAGPSALAVILLLTRQHGNETLALSGAIVVAWALTAAVLLPSPYLHRIIGRRGLIVMERLMGMILVAIAVQMLVEGIQKVIRSA